MKKTMMNTISKKWIGIALVNLSIVAFLGLTLRSKIIFSIPFIDYKHVLHAHSHYAFAGWVTLAISCLMILELLPEKARSHTKYKWILGAMTIFSVGMLVSFPLQGYGLFSILFSTLFIFTTYFFAFFFIKDLISSNGHIVTKLLTIPSLIYLVLSSVGPFTLAYILITKSTNILLYRDSIYTYLHLQYNGFFTLAIIALFFNRLRHLLPEISDKKMVVFAHILNATVLPSMFLSYLWHYPNTIFRVLAIIGSSALVMCTIHFIITLLSYKVGLAKTSPIVKRISAVAMLAFVSKMFMQSLTIFPFLGELVFTNRPMIIGFLHLVLLTFVTLYLLAHFLDANYLPVNKRSVSAVYIFATAVVINELILLLQGFGIMFKTNSNIYAQLLWLVSIGLFSGALLIVRSYYYRKEELNV
ncbi:MAG: hypothetical protein KDC07_09425 [Chitinophagaceae bacterium]|nr:hypothetical protein [Chitinophagaceae bacterium]MCB0700662.1 hypothetical protein [Chitinophagaceae bacterium]